MQIMFTESAPVDVAVVIAFLMEPLCISICKGFRFNCPTKSSGLHAMDEPQRTNSSKETP